MSAEIELLSVGDQGPPGPPGTGADLLAQLTTNNNSNVRLLENPNGGVDLALWNADTNSYVRVRAMGVGAAMTTEFFTYP
jgi:hypothetical protein